MDTARAVWWRGVPACPVDPSQETPPDLRGVAITDTTLRLAVATERVDLFTCFRVMPVSQHRRELGRLRIPGKLESWRVHIKVWNPCFAGPA